MIVASKVGGLDRWRRQIKAIPAKVLSEMKAAQRQNAQDLADSIRAKVPNRTGALQRSVGWSQGLPPHTTATQAFRIKPSSLSDLDAARIEEGLKFCVYAGDNDAYYAKWVEFGTRYSKAGIERAWRRERKFSADGKDRGMRLQSDGRANKRAHHPTRPKPYFWPSIRANSKRMRSRAARAANKALKEVTTV